MRKLVALIFSLSFSFLLFAQKDLIKVTDMLKIKTIGSVALTNNGAKAVFTVTSIDPEENLKWEYKYSTQLWLASPR